MKLYVADLKMLFKHSDWLFDALGEGEDICHEMTSQSISVGRSFISADDCINLNKLGKNKKFIK